MPYIGTKPDKGNFSDLNGAKLILDADADTSITADTDDTIHIEIAGADDFTFTANTLTVLSGSTLTIASGATIANSGTATGFGSNVPTSADGQALGSASLEWSDLYLAESGVIYFGNDQDVTVTHDPDDGLFLKSTATTDNNPVLLTLQTGETDMAANDVMGKISFQAPDEGTGTDAVLVAAAIQARAEGDFSSSSNATSIDFMTGSSEAAATKWSITSAGSFLNAGTNTIDMNAGELILDADADTSITADTDDTIDIKIAGADDFQFTANTFTALSGSTVAIASGATIANSGTATGFGGGSKNLVVNGDMRIKQRTTMPTTGAGYTVDRWQFAEAGAMVATITQDTDVPSGKGFANSLKIVVATEDSSVAAGDYVYIRQAFEGQNLQHLQYGHADAKSLTVSFWTKRPLTGTHCVALYSQDATHRTYVREFTIAVADTWEYFSLTFPGDASGNINDDTGPGIDLIFPLMSGSTWQISADAWSAGQDWATSNIVNDVGIADDIIYLTGVQLEVGDIATDFEHEDYGTQLRKCQRYYLATGVGTVGGALTTANAHFGVQYQVEMRAAPTAALLDATMYIGDTTGSGLVGSPNAIYSSTINSTGCLLYVNGWAAPNALTQHAVLVVYNYGINPFSFTAEI